MITNRSLLDKARFAGADEELDCTRFEVFLHGTSATFADKLVNEQGGCLSATHGKWNGSFFTSVDMEIALAFARRTAGTRETPKVVGLAMCSDVFQRLERSGFVSSPAIDGPPAGVSQGALQFVFTGGAIPELKSKAFFFPVT